MSVAGVVVDRDGKALLIRRRDNAHWEPPGGVLELEESIEDGVRREVKEETGLEIEPVALTGVYKNMVRGIVALVFRCTAVSGELATNDEVTAFQWATAEEVVRLADEAFAVRVIDALHNDRTAVRQHDGVNML
ncbi:NUDIX domain-containing protein [Actinoallomurus acanthiterrae]